MATRLAIREKQLETWTAIIQECADYQNNLDSCSNSRIRINRGSIHIERTDLRYGIDSLARLLRFLGIENPATAGTLYLFCGRRSDRIKGLVWEGDGFLILYKELANGSFQWPRNASEVKSLTPGYPSS